MFTLPQKTRQTLIEHIQSGEYKPCPTVIQSLMNRCSVIIKINFYQKLLINCLNFPCFYFVIISSLCELS